MKISTDGGTTWFEVDQVRVIYDGLQVDEREDAELHINCTAEGVIMDVYLPDVVNSIGSQATTAQEMADCMLLECPESETGKHGFTPDLGYDSSG